MEPRERGKSMSKTTVRAASAPKAFNTPIRSASDCWDWLSPEDVVRHALAAYYATCRRMEGLAQMDGNCKSIDRSVFAADLYQNFGYRVQADGFKKGVCEYWSKAEKELEEMALNWANLNNKEAA